MKRLRELLSFSKKVWIWLSLWLFRMNLGYFSSLSGLLFWKGVASMFLVFRNLFFKILNQEIVKFWLFIVYEKSLWHVKSRTFKWYVDL